MDLITLSTPGQQLTPATADAVAAEFAGVFADLYKKRGFTVANYARLTPGQDEQAPGGVPVTVDVWRLTPRRPFWVLLRRVVIVKPKL